MHSRNIAHGTRVNHLSLIIILDVSVAEENSCNTKFATWHIKVSITQNHEFKMEFGVRNRLQKDKFMSGQSVIQPFLSRLQHSILLRKKGWTLAPTNSIPKIPSTEQ